MQVRISKTAVALGETVVGGATAGLRNVPLATVNKLTNVATSVVLLSGTDEALYEWIAVNADEGVGIDGFKTGTRDRKTLSSQIKERFTTDNKFRNFISAGGASAQLGFTFYNKKVSSTVNQLDKVSEMLTLVGNLNSLLGEVNNRFTCMSNAYEGVTYFNQQAEDFIKFIQINQNTGVITPISFWSDEPSSRNPYSQGTVRTSLSGYCKEGFSCVALVSFLAGQSPDASKKCYHANDRKREGKADENEVHHNLFGGAKETLFNLEALGLATFTSATLSQFSNFNECYGSGPTAGKIVGKCITEGHAETMENLRKLMGHDKFFTQVTEFTKSVASHANWYGGGSFAKYAPASSGSNSADFGWGNTFMKTYFIEVTGEKKNVKDNLQKSVLTEGDWAFGLAFFNRRSSRFDKMQKF